MNRSLGVHLLSTPCCGHIVLDIMIDEILSDFLVYLVEDLYM